MLGMLRSSSFCETWCMLILQSIMGKQATMCALDQPCIPSECVFLDFPFTSKFIQLVLLKIELLKFLHLLLGVCIYLEAGSVWATACNLPPSTCPASSSFSSSCTFCLFSFCSLLLRSQSPSPLCFSQVRKFVSKDSAGLRVRSHPSLQSEQIGIVHVNGTITFIDEVIDFRPGRI